MLSSELSKHMSSIGKLGGERRKLNPDRFILAREAARFSWSPSARAKRLSKKRANHKEIAHPSENKV